METLLIVIAVLLTVLGFVGSIVPALPGPPLSYIALLLLQWAIHPFSTTLLVVTGIITLLIVAFDYLLPVWTAKKYGATKQGVWGSVIGMMMGIIFPPIGMIAGLIVGAVVGDLIAGRSFSQAATSASGTVFGTLITIGLKLTWCVVLSYYLISRIIIHYY